MGFLLLGKGDSKKAAEIQAKATRDAAAAATRDSMYATQAAESQKNAALALRNAQQTASDLLSVPMESADVDLAGADADNSDDLLRKRKSPRSAYQSGDSGISL
jgi:hypothetical protein